MLFCRSRYPGQRIVVEIISVVIIKESSRCFQDLSVRFNAKLAKKTIKQWRKWKMCNYTDLSFHHMVRGNFNYFIVKLFFFFSAHNFRYVTRRLIEPFENFYRSNLFFYWQSFRCDYKTICWFGKKWYKMMTDVDGEMRKKLLTKHKNHKW